MGTLSGWRFVLASSGLFLGPLVLAIMGAACFGSRGETQIFGAVLGLAGGMIGSLAVAAFPRRTTGHFHDDNNKPRG